MNSYWNKFKYLDILDDDFKKCTYIFLFYLRTILTFAWLTGYVMLPVLQPFTVHTDSFTAK